MKKRGFVVWLMATLLVIPALVIMEGAGAGAEKKPIKIGVVTSKSSFLAYHGKYAEWGYTMAAEEVNGNGGVLGRPVELIWRDTQAKPDVAVREARDLVFGEKVDYLIGCFITSTTNAVSTLAKENKVLFMGSGVGVALTEEDGHRYFFRLSANSTMMAKSMAMLVQRKGYKKVWIIAPDYAFGHQWVDDGKIFLKELIPGVQIIGENFTPLGEKDFGPYIADMSRAKPDVVFSVLYGRDQGSFVKQANSFGLFKNTQYVADFGPESLRPYGLEVPEGLLGMSYYEFLIPKTPENKKFSEKFKSKYGDWPSREAMHYYNAVHLLALAIKAAGKTDTEAVIDALEKVRYKSPLGELWYRKIDHQINMPLIIGELERVPGADYLAVTKNAELLRGETLWHSEAEVKAAREKAKK
jgi:branched-chain amino acid transport system substrate-binding protein